MAHHRLAGVAASVVLISCVLIGNALPSEDADKKPKLFDGIEFLTGYGLAKLREKGNYQVTPLFVDVGFDLKPLLSRNGITYAGLLQAIGEPFAGYVSDPQSNIEGGCNVALKAGIVPDDRVVQPYVKGGFGVIYMTQHAPQQGSQLNFDEYIGAGVHFVFEKNIAFTLEYRYRHISNGGITPTNKGINTNFTMCGISYRY